MQSPDAIQRWRNRQAELDFHLCRLRWFLGKAAILDPLALQRKIDGYQTEWNVYEKHIQTALLPRRKAPNGVRPTAGVVHAA
jgi:hypothetical protein